MTMSQLFESVPGRKTIWTKEGDKISKREISALDHLKSRKTIKTKEEQS